MNNLQGPSHLREDLGQPLKHIRRSDQPGKPTYADDRDRVHHDGGASLPGRGQLCRGTAPVEVYNHTLVACPGEIVLEVPCEGGHI